MYKTYKYCLIFLCCSISYSGVVEIGIDTVDIKIYNPIYLSKTAVIYAYWSIYNKGEEEIDNISPPWSGDIQDRKFGVKDKKYICGNSNLIIYNSVDTLFPPSRGPLGVVPCRKKYYRLKIPPGDSVTGVYCRDFTYKELEKFLTWKEDCYLKLLYDSRYEQDDDSRHSLRDKRKIGGLLAKANEIDVNQYDHKRDIYEDIYKIKPLRIESEKYTLTKGWWEKVDRSITYYTCIYQIADTSRQRGNFMELVSVISIGELGYKDLIPYLIKEVDADTAFDMLSHFAVESLVKLNSFKAVPFLINYYLNSKKNEYIMNGNYYVRKGYNEIEEYNDFYSYRFDMEELKEAFLSQDQEAQSDSLRIREKGIIYLKELTGKTLGYDPDASEEDREAAIKRWKEWWENNKNRYLKEDRDNTGSKVNIFKERMKY